MRPRNAGTFNHRFFALIDTEPKAYWLGFLMADGAVCDVAKKGAMQLRIHLQKGDQAHVERFHEAIRSNNRVAIYENSVYSSHSSDLLCADLTALGCTPRKSLTLQYPSKVPHELEWHFIRGYFDGDGSACINGTRLFLSFSGTLHFLRVLRQRIGISESKHIIQRGNISVLQLSAIQSCQRFVVLTYRDATIFLPRKKAVIDRWMTFLRGRVYSTGRRYAVPDYFNVYG